MTTAEQTRLFSEPTSNRTGKELGLTKKGGAGAQALLKALVRRGLDANALKPAATIVLLLDEMACNGNRS